MYAKFMLDTIVRASKFAPEIRRINIQNYLNPHGLWHWNECCQNGTTRTNIPLQLNRHGSQPFKYLSKISKMLNHHTLTEITLIYLPYILNCNKNLLNTCSRSRRGNSAGFQSYSLKEILPVGHWEEKQKGLTQLDSPGERELKDRCMSMEFTTEEKLSLEDAERLNFEVCLCSLTRFSPGTANDVTFLLGILRDPSGFNNISSSSIRLLGLAPSGALTIHTWRSVYNKAKSYRGTIFPQNCSSVATYDLWFLLNFKHQNT